MKRFMKFWVFLFAITTLPAYAIDRVKPDLKQIDVLNVSVDASRRDAYLDIRLIATDDFSGLYDGAIRLVGPGPVVFSAQVNEIRQNFVLNGGRAQSFTIRVGMPRRNGMATRYFEANTIPGEWKIDSVSLRDRAFNLHDYSVTDGSLDAVAGVKTFVVNNRLYDLKGPKLAAARILTPTVDLAAEYPQVRVSMDIYDEGNPNAIGSDLVSLEFCKLPVFYLPTGAAQCTDRIGVGGNIAARSRVGIYSGAWRSLIDTTRGPSEGRYCAWLVQIRDLMFSTFSQTFTARPLTDPRFSSSLFDYFTNPTPPAGGALAPVIGAGVFPVGGDCFDVINSSLH